jgi:hypothetical protein
MKKFVFRSNKYNITHQDIQRGVEDRGYIDDNYVTSDESNPLDKWYRFGATRNDENIFINDNTQFSRVHIHDISRRLYDHLSNSTAIFADVERQYNVGYNFTKQKIYNFVEDYLLANPESVLTFQADSKVMIVTLSELIIKNITIFRNEDREENISNTTLPGIVINSVSLTNFHKDGKFERGLQSPFTEQSVGGYKHRHHPIGSVEDRPERFKISDTGTSIVFSSPLSGASGLDYNVPYSRVGRDGLTRAAASVKNIRSTNNKLGNFFKNYQVLSGLDRRHQNLALVDNPDNFAFQKIDSPYLSGVLEYGLPTRTLSNGEYGQAVFVYRFGAPGDAISQNPNYMDPESEQYTAYNTVNYRNPIPRAFLKLNLASGSYFGGYFSGSYEGSASYQKNQRNNRYVFVSGTSTTRLRPDNAYVSYQIPALDGGVSWIKKYATGGNNPGLFINGTDNDISFVSNSVDSIGFTPLSSEFYSISSITSSTLDTTTSNVLRKFNIKFNGLWGYTTKQQVSNNYHKLIVNQRKQNYYIDEIYKDGIKTRQHEDAIISCIGDKYSNLKNVYEIDGKEVETLSYPFAEEYVSLVPNYYSVKENKIKNFYYDFRNIKYKNKSKSLFKKLLILDRLFRLSEGGSKSIKLIICEEKVWPRGQVCFRDFARVRNDYYQKWADDLDDRLTEVTNSQGQAYELASQINNYSGDVYSYSSWPLDANTNTGSGLYVGVRDKSGELLQIDNVILYSSLYTYNSIQPPSSSYFGARFSRNWNLNRPANVVQEQAGRGPYFNSYSEYYEDIRSIGQDCSVIPEYRISPKLDLYYAGSVDSYYSLGFNTLELTGTAVENLASAVSTSSAFIEQRINSDFIDAADYLNKELKDFKLNTLKVKVKGIKKLLPYEEFYPQTRMVKLAQQLSASYSRVFTFAGAGSTFRTVLAPFYSPGIGFNSVKTGVGMPYSVVVSSSATAYSDITSSISNAAAFYQKASWESILDPRLLFSKLETNKIYDIDPDIQVDSTGTFQVLNSDYDYIYSYLSNNFYSEVVNFFKKDSTLSNLESTDSNSWYFPDLTKTYYMSINISKTRDYMSYSSLEGYGPKPYVIHNPPWLRSISSTAVGYNSDVSRAPGENASNYSSAKINIFFKPSSLTGSNLYTGAGANFSISDILSNSTIVAQGPSTNDVGATQATDLIDIYSISADGTKWLPRIKWECPTADLNFYNLNAKLTNSSGNDSGEDVAGSAVRGIWHQYGSLGDRKHGIFLSAEDNFTDTANTASLLSVVGFDRTKKIKLGEISDYSTISECLMVIPFYQDDCGEDVYFDIEIPLFERMFSENQGIVGEIKEISRKYILPPSMDFIRTRDLAGRYLQKEEYGQTKSPFLMFPIEFFSTLSRQDLSDIWQGVMPEISTKAEVEEKEKEFFIGDYLKEMDYRLPENTRFKVFKIKKRGVSNYQQIIDRTQGKEYIDLSYGYNWPYDFCSLVEMAEVKVEMVYGYDVGEDTKRVQSNVLDSEITILESQVSTEGAPGRRRSLSRPESPVVMRQAENSPTSLFTTTNNKEVVMAASVTPKNRPSLLGN